MAKAIHIIDDNGNVIEPEKAAVFTFNDDPDSETCDVTAEMVGMSGKDLYLLVKTAIALGQRIGMFGEEDDDG